VRLPGDLIDTLKEQGKAVGRSVPAEAESRLRESLGRGAWATVEPQLTPRARSLGRLLGFLANELTAYSPPGNEDDFLQHGVARILERLSGKVLPGPGHDGAMMADYWWLRMVNAHEPVTKAGEAMPLTDEQKVLLEIRENLLTHDAKPANASRSRKERK
jgi:hypothetical protein